MMIQFHAKHQWHAWEFNERHTGMKTKKQGREKTGSVITIDTQLLFLLAYLKPAFDYVRLNPVRAKLLRSQ
jgi:hypothetical protein